MFPPCEAFFLTTPRCQHDQCGGIADGQPRGWHQQLVSKFNRVAPGRRCKALPALGLQGRPELFCFGLSQVSAFLQQGRAVRQAPASVDEDLRLMDPSLLIAMESPDPAVVAVNQPALSHDHAVSTSVLAMASIGGQVASCLKLKPKKRAGPSAHPLRDAWKAPLLSRCTVHDAGALAGIDSHAFRHYCLVRAVLIRVMIRVARASLPTLRGVERAQVPSPAPPPPQKKIKGGPLRSSCLGTDGLIQLPTPQDLLSHGLFQHQHRGWCQLFVP